MFVVGVPAVAWVLPTGHTSHAAQLAAFSVEVNVPVAQSPQVRFVVALPAVSTYLPATQAVRFTHGVAAEPSSSQVPAGQVTGGFVPPLHEVPAAQGVHPGGVVLVPGVVSVVPGGQAAGAVHSKRFALRATLPDAQASHVRSSLALGALAICVPIAQVVQGLQLDWLLTVVKLPVGQPAHTWSAVAVPAFSMYEPASHVPYGEHDVELVPAEKLPAAHATQTVSLVPVATTARNVPGAQAEMGWHSVAGSKSSSNVPLSQATAADSSPAQ